MNVYVAALARHLALGGADVDVLTRSDPGVADVVDVSPAGPGRVRVVPVPVAGPSQVIKDDLPAHLPAFAAEVLRLAGPVPPGRPPYDVVHGHYWLSGEVAVTLGAAWHVPVVQTMHTLAAAKEAAGGAPETPARRAGERRVAAAVAALVCSTGDEAAALVEHVGADPGRVHVVAPGVDADLFSPPEGDSRLDARDGLGVPRDALLVLFVGRVQAHKGPDLLVRAVAAAVADRPDVRRRLLVTMLGGPSGPDGRTAADLDELARELGVADLLSWRGRVPRDELARWYRAADVVAVPSRHESFGLVALEAQASGTAVLAARAGGLVTAVDDGVSGVLVAGRDPAEWGRRLLALLDDPRERARLGVPAPSDAERFSWAATAAATAAVYEEVIAGGPAPADAAGTARAVRRFLDAAGVDHTPGARPGEVVATVPGERRRSIVVSFLAGAHSVSASSFVCRRPEDDPSSVHAWLLRRNARLPGIAFAIDAHGDIHLVGRVPSAAVAGPSAQAVLDDLLGAVVRTVEDSFDEILARGFATAIRAEHAWRVARGLPTDNLAAFARVVDEHRHDGP
jgi:D-inositol-3-phosphate glycosyltransferase